MSLHQLSELVAAWGYFAVFALLFVESAGLPLPGETILIVTAIYAAHTHRLSIALVIATGSLAAFAGAGLGYLVGRKAGLPLLERHGGLIGLSPARQRLGQYLFLRHGAKIVFLGRFITLLRTFAGILAGANAMPWRRFLLFSGLGAVAWTATIGLGAYLFGRLFVRLVGPVGLAAAVLAGLTLLAAFLVLRRQEDAWQKLADAALPSTPPPARGET